MRKFFVLLFFVLFSVVVQAQVLVNLQLPVIGLSTKNQLWSMALINTGRETIRLRGNLIMTDEATNQIVMTASTAEFTLMPGSHVFQVTDFSPIIYSVVNSSYGIDNNPNGFLPVGHFIVCYQFDRFVSDTYEKFVEECENAEVEPVSPPQLIFPEDQGVLEFPQPVFSWLPPSPMNFFSLLSYDLRMVKLEGKQLPADAMQQNIALFAQQNIYTLSVPYPASLPVLDTGVVYAWQVVAKNNNKEIARSDVWSFSIKKFSPAADKLLRNGFFARLKNADGPVNYFLCSGKLQVAYDNYTDDDSVYVAVNDLNNQRSKMSLDSEYLRLKRGLNFIEIDLKTKNAFSNDHIFEFELVNSRGEKWIGRFYLKRKEEENK
ncbi:MAG: hypothetical protein ABI675_29750 [Chitinophagaceae bacterium]